MAPTTRDLLASTALYLMPVAAAFAADLPSRTLAPAAPIVTAAPFSWGGFYAGAQVGWQQSRFRGSETYEFAPLTKGEFLLRPIQQPEETSRRLNVNGVVAGGHAGYNYQIGGFVLGIEGDLEYAGLSKTLSTSFLGAYGENGFDAGQSIEAGQSWQGSIRARFGYAMVDRLLLYVTGGAAVADMSHRYVVRTMTFGPATYSHKFSDVRWGWTIGAGVEYMFSDRWSVRAEYRYSDFGNARHTRSLPNLAIVNTTALKTNTVRLGLTYHFNSGVAAPVLARY